MHYGPMMYDDLGISCSWMITCTPGRFTPGKEKDALIGQEALWTQETWRGDYFALAENQT
jgi:hypothetical protein